MTPRLQSFHEWLLADPKRTLSAWLILGKGPSFARLKGLEAAGKTDGLLRFGLNHVVRETCVDVFHTIDIEVIEHCGEAILNNAGIAVLPWAPHVRRRLVPFSGYREFLPSGQSLADYLETYAVLRRLAGEGRLFWYNLRSAPRRLRRPEAPIIAARGFSASAAVALLAAGGVHRIRTLGIDGGSAYAGSFGDLTDKTLLAAGQASFDTQFTAIADSIRRHDLDLLPLNHPGPARVLIRATPAQRLPARVLANSLLRRASLSVEAIDVPSTGAEQPFAARGRAISIDAGCVVRADLRELWLDEAAFGAVAPGFGGEALAQAVCLVTPGAAGQAGVRRYPVPLPRWTAARCGSPEARDAVVVHWPSDGVSPWRCAEAADARIWCDELLQAVADGTVTRNGLAAEIARGHARQSLLWQVDHRIADPVLLPRRVRRNDPPVRPPAGTMPDSRKLLHHYSLALAQVRRLLAAIRWPLLRRRTDLILDKVFRIMRGIGD